MAKRKLTRKQIASGFGGKRAQSALKGRRKKPARKSSRRTSTSKPGTRARAAKPAKRRRRSSGGGGGGGKKFLGLSLPGIDIQAAAFVAGGMIGVNVVPGLIAKVWPGIPRYGAMGYAVKAVSVIGLGMAVKMAMKSSSRANQVVAGGLALLMFEAFNEFAAPRLGLSGLSGDLATVGDLSGIVDSSPSNITYIRPGMSQAVREAEYAS